MIIAFFGPSRGEFKEIVYSVDDTICSNEWKNLQIIMLLDFVYFNRKLQVKELFRTRDHGIQDYLISDTAATRKTTLCAFSVNLDFGCPMEMYSLNPALNLHDLYVSVSNTAK